MVKFCIIEMAFMKSDHVACGLSETKTKLGPFKAILINCIFIQYKRLLIASVVWWSEFLAAVASGSISGATRFSE
jgi:hypothetical protein